MAQQNQHEQSFQRFLLGLAMHDAETLPDLRPTVGYPGLGGFLLKPAQAPLEPVTATTAEEKVAPAEKAAVAATLPSQTTELPASQETKPARRDTAAAHGKHKDCTVRLPYVVITIPCIT